MIEGDGAAVCWTCVVAWGSYARLAARRHGAKESGRLPMTVACSRTMHSYDDGLRPEMTMAELADHLDAIQRLAEARADATLRRIRERADESCR